MDLLLKGRQDAPVSDSLWGVTGLGGLQVGGGVTGVGLFRPHLNSDPQTLYGLSYFLSRVYGVIISNSRATLRTGKFCELVR